MNIHDITMHSLAAYVFGALEPSERTEVSGHLLVCAICREELASLAGLPGLLSRVDPADIEMNLPAGSAELGAGLLERSLAELGRRRRADRLRRAVAVAASAAVIGTIGGLAREALSSPPHPGPPVSGRSYEATDPTTGVHALFNVSAQSWGTQIKVQLDGATQGTHCVLMAIDNAGRRTPIGSWRSIYEQTAAVTTATDTTPKQLRALEVDTNDGHHLVSVHLT
jgi:hypothetical protein